MKHYGGGRSGLRLGDVSAAVAATLLPLEQQRASCLPFFGTLLDLSACSRTLDSHENLVHFFICAPALPLRC